MKKVALNEVKDELSKYLRMAEGEEIVITSHGRPAGPGSRPKVATRAPFGSVVKWERASPVRPGGSACTRYLRVFTLGTDEHAPGTFECARGR